ncbi:PREDICTED: uncharacterized protein LOC109220446 [Nicotiana attenuata]|uniref:uncharacterized protein LOC109220446 n=1 Tax=Nicotiana attenuata TaxID=49451 RepID=UPI0009056A2D|nr:PREDICTED: uncharacterized protein LOC109220446 [Nicotiana attenuata]
MAITTRSGKILRGENEQVVEVEDSEQEVEAQVEVPIVVEAKKVPEEVKIQEVNREEVKEKVKEMPKTLAPIPRPPPPFPQRLARKVDDIKLEKFYDILKQLSVNIPFVEAFHEMPGFAKYLKDLITKNEVEIPIILGRPFLATGRALMDSKRNEIKFRVNNEEVTFQASKGMKLPHAYESISVIDVVDEVEDAIEMKMEDQCLEGYKESVNALEGLGSYTYAPKNLSLDLENRVTPSAKPSIIEPPQLELKPLPPHLRYRFLSSNDTLSVIVSCLLNDVQVEQLLNVLREHMQGIGWTIADIRGIPARICEHKIQLEQESKPSVENQCRLNPSMQEVVKKEIIKWLDVGVVYPIADSSWVSPVQCVTKKGGLTMIQKDKNELIPTRTVTGWRVILLLLGRISGYNQINIALEDQENTTFTCPYGTFAFSHMPFGLCNAPATFQRCMMPIFSDMVADFFEVFMDDFSVVGDSFKRCLDNLRQVLKDVKKQTLC